MVPPRNASRWARISGRRSTCATISRAASWGIFRYDADWNSWEMHPDGDEIVMLLSGAVDLVLDEPGGERTVELRDRATAVVPRGVWHTANAIAPSEALHITRGAGTHASPPLVLAPLARSRKAVPAGPRARPRGAICFGITQLKAPSAGAQSNLILARSSSRMMKPLACAVPGNHCLQFFLNADACVDRPGADWDP